MFHEESSAQLHTVLCTETMDFDVDGVAVHLDDGQRLFPMHSFKFTSDQMKAIANQNGWKLVSQHSDPNCSTALIHTYE